MLKSSTSPSNRHLLIVTHNVATESKGGGVEIYQEHLRSLPGYDVSFLYAIRKGGKSRWCFQHKGAPTIYFILPEEDAGTWTCNPHQEKMFASLLQKYAVDLISFQHLLGMSLSLPLISHKMGIPGIYMLHDHFLICPKYTLLDPAGYFCNIFEESKTQCDFCLHETHKAPLGWQAERRNWVARILESLDAIVASTPYTRDAILKIYPQTSREKFHVIEMLLPPQVPQKQASPAASLAGQLRVVVPGNFIPAKGSDAVMKLIAGLEGENISFRILGTSDQAGSKTVTENPIFKDTVFVSAYQAEHAVSLMADSDVSLHLSTGPETYMITLSEARQAGVVPIVSNLGAQAERVMNGVNGFIVPPRSIGQVKDILLDLRDHPEKLQKMKQASRKVPVMDAAGHISKLKALYDTVIQRRDAKPV